MSLKSTLLSAVALATLSSAAHAQATNAATVGEVVITGQRRVNENAIALKRSNTQMVESATADEIGRLPDFNAGDALKRLSGVNVTLYQGEPRFASIRGLNANYTSVTIDGFTMATPDTGGRQVYMEVLPSDLASHIDVLKTSSADVDAHGLGGVINFASASAFDRPDEHLVLSARAGRNLQEKQFGGASPVGDAGIKLSTLFGPRRQFGVIISANYWLRDIHIPQIFVNPTIGFFDDKGVAAPAYGGNGIQVPIARQWYNYTDNRKRAGGSGRLDWRPDDSLRGDISAFYYWQREAADRNDSLGGVAANSTVLSQTPTSGQLNNVTQTYRLARLRFDRQMYGLNGALTKRFGNDLTAEVRAGWSGSRLNNPQFSDRFAQAGFTMNYEVRDTLPIWTPTNLTNYQNLSLYKFQDRVENKVTLGEDVYDVQGFVARNMERGAQGLGFKIGGKLVRTQQDNHAFQTTYTGATYTLANLDSGQRLCSFLCNDGGIVLISPSISDQMFGAQKSALKATDNATTRYGGDYNVTEDIASGYAMAQYVAPWGLVAGGLRYEHTRLDADGFQQVGGVWGPAVTKQTYGNLLPSINLKLNAGENGLVRAAISQTIGRPRLDAIATHGGVLNTAASPVTLSMGNPDLKPLRANNYDLAYERYFGHGRGMISLGVFYKTISDALFTYGQLETQSINGVSTPVLVTQYRNTSKDVRMKGFEATITRDFDFLPKPFDGLGITANATLASTTFPITLSDGSLVTINTLPQQAREIYNVALYYDSARFHAKLAWNHTGREWDDRFSNFVSKATFYQNRYVEPLNYVDLHLSYAVRSDTSATFDVQNLTSEDNFYTFGRDQEATHDRIGFAPSVMVGLTFKH